MKVHFLISSEESGTVILKSRKIAKALRRWLHEHGYPFKYVFFMKP